MKIMILTQKNRLKLSPKKFEIIKQLSFYSARLYNVGLYSVRQYYCNNHVDVSIRKCVVVKVYADDLSVDDIWFVYENIDEVQTAIWELSKTQISKEALDETIDLLSYI
jgi:hypothetical protein